MLCATERANVFVGGRPARLLCRLVAGINCHCDDMMPRR